MRCALAAKRFINGDIFHNKKVITDTLTEQSAKADIVVFGEAFLQGFYGVTFDVEHDAAIAVSRTDPVIKEIVAVAQRCAVAVSFGLIEKAENRFYSAQVTIDADGKVIDWYRRVSPGWKEPFADTRYCEGERFHAFTFMGKRIAVALCGDLWYDENIAELRRLCPEVIFWPVYTDFNCDEWNDSMKHEYAVQAAKACENVLYVNSVCLDKTDDESAKGGAVFYSHGRIAQEVPSGEEAILLVEV